MASTAGVAGLKFLRAIVWVIYAAAVAAIIVLAFAFVLLMFSANPANEFAQAVARLGAFFATPFVALIRPTPLDNGGTIAWSLLFAIAAYGVVVALSTAALTAIGRRIVAKTRAQVVGERTVTSVHTEPGGDVVRTATKSPVMAEEPRQQAQPNVAPPQQQTPETAEPVAPQPVPAGVGARQTQDEERQS